MSFLDNFVTNSTSEQNSLNQERENLLQQDQLRDFNTFDSSDLIHQEFDSPENDSLSWKALRPPLKTSLLDCFHVVFMITLVVGAAVGFLALCIVYLDINTADICFGTSWNSVPRRLQSIHVAGQAVEGFVIELWQFLTVLPVFKWPLIHKLNLVPLNLIAAFSDSVYRLFLHLFDSYQSSWRSYPLNGLFCFTVISNGLIIGRDKYPTHWRKALGLSLRLSSQFVIGTPVTYMLVYFLFPWYTQQTNEYFKVIIAGCAPLTAFIPKVVSRIAAQNLKGVNHPGTSFILAATVYNATSIVFRIMQADLESFSLFVALGIGHAFFDLLERLSITYRDFIWQYLYTIICCWRGEIRRNVTTKSCNTYRAQRLVADMSIQCMLAESAALINAVGFMQLFEFIFHRQSTGNLLWEFFRRVGAGLSIDCLFSVISVLLQTRTMNIAVVRVWKAKWKLHALINLITAAMVVLYFSEHLLMVVKSKHKGGEMVNFVKNCSQPFTRQG